MEQRYAARTWIKICGLTREEDVEVAVGAGADAVGFVFADSPRRITAERARELVDVARGWARVRGRRVTAVGVFLGIKPPEVADVVMTSGIEAVQFYGAAPEFAELRRIIPTLAFACLAGRHGVEPSPFEALKALTESEAPDAVLYDGSEPGAGVTYDWSAVAGHLAVVPVVLAGGLGPSNVGEAVQRVRPWGVDVSSGVESEPGIKDPFLITEFIGAVRAAEVAPPPGRCLL
ncbi:MAG: N-(5'-phosphoribosyl)anthranilate isomerase [Acidobacteria bacterium]|nr:MAG: N-(5'-phosphoribosyl)anthranilate isomerase [Acidobacteriota bacterium]